MNRIATKTRPFKHPQKRGTPRPLVAGIHAIELGQRPPEAEELSGPRMKDPGAAERRTVVCLNQAEGPLLASATVVCGPQGAWGERLTPSARAKTAWLADLRVRDADPKLLHLIAYAAARRARIDGATTLAAQLYDPERSVTEALGLVPVDGVEWQSVDIEDRTVALVPVAQRLDLALARAHAGYLAQGGTAVHPRWFIDEVEETLERWLHSLYGRGFFRAVFEHSLTRDQYVYAASNMHQFVRWTTRLLGDAVACSHDRGLRDHFLSHLQGEVNHELIIERDLAHLGVDLPFVVETMAPSVGTRHFMAIQESLIGFHRDPVSFMASPLAAEGIASHLTPTFIEAMADTIRGWGVEEPHKAMAFFTSHVHTDGGDDGHWEMTLAKLALALTDEPAAARFLANLRASMGALTRAYDEYVEDLGVLGLGPAEPQPAVTAAIA